MYCRKIAIYSYSLAVLSVVSACGLQPLGTKGISKYLFIQEESLAYSNWAQRVAFIHAYNQMTSVISLLKHSSASFLPLAYATPISMKSIP